MKLRVRLAERGTVASPSASIPTFERLRFGPDGQEDAHFVPIGPGTPGRRMPSINLIVDQLVPGSTQDLELGGEYVLTLEPLAAR